MEQEHTKYLIAHIVQALAEDRRACILGIQVKIIAARLFLIGEVETDERRQVAEIIARELVPEGMEVVNQLWVPIYERPQESEALH